MFKVCLFPVSKARKECKKVVSATCFNQTKTCSGVVLKWLRLCCSKSVSEHGSFLEGTPSSSLPRLASSTGSGSQVVGGLLGTKNNSRILEHTYFTLQTCCCCRGSHEGQCLSHSSGSANLREPARPTARLWRAAYQMRVGGGKAGLVLGARVRRRGERAEGAREEDAA